MLDGLTIAKRLKELRAGQSREQVARECKISLSALGLTDADIKKARTSADGLYKFLMDRMGGVEDMANEFPKTFAGILS